MKKYMKWTDEELCILADEREKKTAFSEIQKRLFPYRSEKSITEKAFREGLQHGYGCWNDELEKTLVKLRKQGKTFSEIKTFFPNHSLTSLRIKAMRLGCTASK